MKFTEFLQLNEASSAAKSRILDKIDDFVERYQYIKTSKVKLAKEFTFEEVYKIYNDLIKLYLTELHVLNPKLNKDEDFEISIKVEMKQSEFEDLLKENGFKLSYKRTTWKGSGGNRFNKPVLEKPILEKITSPTGSVFAVWIKKNGIISLQPTMRVLKSFYSLLKFLKDAEGNLEKQRAKARRDRVNQQKYKYTTMSKWEGDDAYSWAVFDKNNPMVPMVSGLSRDDAYMRRQEFEAKLAKKYEK